MMFHERMASWACNSNNCTNAASTRTSYFVFKVPYMYFQFVTQTIKKTCPWDLIKCKLLLFHQGHPYVEPALVSSTEWWQWGTQWSLVRTCGCRCLRAKYKWSHPPWLLRHEYKCPPGEKDNVLVLLWKTFWLHGPPWKCLRDPARSADHTLRTARLERKDMWYALLASWDLSWRKGNSMKGNAGLNGSEVQPRRKADRNQEQCAGRMCLNQLWIQTKGHSVVLGEVEEQIVSAQLWRFKAYPLWRGQTKGKRKSPWARMSRLLWK